MIYDAIVIGGGVVGAATLHALSKYEGNYLLIEAQTDLACGCSGANSGIVHAGYDCVPGTKKAYFNVKGAEMFPEVCKILKVGYRETGSLVLGRKQDLPTLEKLLLQGQKNRTKGISIIDRKRIEEIQPNVNEKYVYALYSETTASVSPYAVTVAFAETAILNGAKVLTDAALTGVKKEGDLFVLTTTQGEFTTRFAINAAGAGCPKVSRLFGGEEIPQTLRKGEYYLLDTQKGDRPVKTIVYPCPSEMGKGILVIPTQHDNVLLGPTAKDILENDTTVTQEGLAAVKKGVTDMMYGLSFGDVIRVFSGVRVLSGHDFIVEPSKKVKGLYHLAGICSPGLSSSPALGQHVAAYAAEFLGKELKAEIKENTPRVHVKNRTTEEKNELVKKNPAYGKIVCRCETVTEGEILDEFKRPLPPKTMDGLKKRLRTGMGRCQGGFCWPRIIELLEREGYPVSAITKSGAGSEICVSRIKGDTL